MDLEHPIKNQIIKVIVLLLEYCRIMWNRSIIITVSFLDFLFHSRDFLKFSPFLEDPEQKVGSYTLGLKFDEILLVLLIIRKIFRKLKNIII